MTTKRTELTDARILASLLNEHQAEHLSGQGHKIVGVIIEGQSSDDDIEQMLAENFASSEYHSLRRRAALGDIVAGIAHQSRNIMTGVLSFAQIARRRSEEPKLTKLLDNIEAESFRCVELLSQVLILARSRDAAAGGHLEPCSLCEILASACSLVEPKMNDGGIEFIHFCSSESLPEVMGDPGALRDVFVNLLQNSADATPSGGKVVVTAEVRGPTVALIFDDSGTGVAAEHRESVFTPSFTTKGIGKGTGLGLAVSQQVVLEHGGSLLVEESPQGGARFLVLLPAAGETTP